MSPTETNPTAPRPETRDSSPATARRERGATAAVVEGAREPGAVVESNAEGSGINTREPNETEKQNRETQIAAPANGTIEMSPSMRRYHEKWKHDPEFLRRSRERSARWHAAHRKPRKPRRDDEAEGNADWRALADD